MSSPIRKAVFPVGGLGTRFLPATKALPKEMLPVVDKPLIQYAAEEAWAAGVEELIFVTGRGKTAIEDHFDNGWELQATLVARGRSDLLEDLQTLLRRPGEIVYTRQQEPLGLDHGHDARSNRIGQSRPRLDHGFQLGRCLDAKRQTKRQTSSGNVSVIVVNAGIFGVWCR